MNVTIPKGFSIGCAQNEFTGVTVILSRKARQAALTAAAERPAPAKPTCSVPKR